MLLTTHLSSSNSLLQYCPHCGAHINTGDTSFQSLRLSVLVPVYNEAATIKTLLKRVEQVPIPKEIIVVDDGSTDGTRHILKKLGDATQDRPDFDNALRIFYHDENRGKGAALRQAIDEAQGDVVIIQDADLEYDPKDYHRMLHPIVAGNADVVYGSRFKGSEGHRVLYFWHYVGNRIITLFSNMFTNLNLSDIETCYKAFRTDILDDIQLEQSGFGIEVEITSKVAKLKPRIYEVGISYFGRTYEEGKKITWKDGVRALYLILKYR